MNFTGKLEGLKMDYVTRKQSLSLEVNEDARDAFQELKDCEKLVIQIKKYRKKKPGCECILLGADYKTCQKIGIEQSGNAQYVSGKIWTVGNNGE